MAVGWDEGAVGRHSLLRGFLERAGDKCPASLFSDLSLCCWGVPVSKPSWQPGGRENVLKQLLWDSLEVSSV